MRCIPLLLLAVACATPGASRAGVVAFKSSLDEAVPPVSYSVGPGRITGASLDATVEGGCIRGTMAGEPLQLCAGKPEADGTQSWSGSSGAFTLQPVEQGRAFRVSGNVALQAGTLIDVTQTLWPGKGSGWDELRAQPALLLLATTATDLRVLQRRHRNF